MAEYLIDVLLVWTAVMSVAGLMAMAIWPWLPGSQVKRPPFYLSGPR
jgi:hypothetical protein